MRTFLRTPPPPSAEMSLQITSMADIFMIILVFLLKTYGSGLIDLVPPAGMSIPLVATFAGNPGSGADALKVEVSKSAVTVEGHTVAQIENYTFPKMDLAANGSSRLLRSALEKERNHQMLLVKGKASGQTPGSEPALQIDSRIIVVADQQVPYGTIKAVLASAAVNGYTDFKLAVVNPN